MNKDIQREVISYLVQPKYKMVDWIKPYFEHVKNEGRKIFWQNLACNKFSHDFLLENYPDKIRWDKIVSNPNAVDFIIENIDKIDVKDLEQNPDYRLYKYYKNHTNNYFANPFWIKKIDKLIYEKSGLFGLNTEYQLEEYDLDIFMLNPNAYILFEKYENEINWDFFKNKNLGYMFLEYEKSYPFFIRNYNKIYSKNIYLNPLIINYAKENISKVDFEIISYNKNIIDFMFSIINNKYILNYKIKKFDIHNLISNENFVKFMINNNFYYKDKEYIGKDYLLKMVKTNGEDGTLTSSKAAIPLIKNKYINSFPNDIEYSIFLNDGIFEIDIPGSYKRYDRFITKN